MANSSAARLRDTSNNLKLSAQNADTNIVALVPSEKVSVPISQNGGQTSMSSDALAADHFKIREGAVFAGTHLLIEMWGAENLSDPDQIGEALERAATAAGATVLHSYMHPFGPEMGVSGVVVLAESHISIHTWPERGYAALDIFMCGACDPYDSVSTLETAFHPGRITIDEQRRGIVE
jgi:S-adenosylmethionine decarboxylase